MTETRIIFMGTPEFSVPALERLASEKDMTVRLVVTQPDRPKGRGRQPAPSPVKQSALKLGIDVFQPERINTEEAAATFVSLEPDFYVVTAYGQILSQRLLDIPRIYPVNIHASLLPRYRGPSPVQAAILNMDTMTGVTTIVMQKAMDKGDILMSAQTPLSDRDTTQDLHDRLALMGADLIVKTIRAVLKDNIQPVPQDESRATYVKMLTKSDGQINWHLPGPRILAHIRAMTPWPSAFTRLGNKMIKIFKALYVDEPCLHDPGVIFRCDRQGIHVATGQGSLVVLELMGASGKRLKADEFLRGHAITPPLRFDDGQ